MKVTKEQKPENKSKSQGYSKVQEALPKGLSLHFILLDGSHGCPGIE